MKNRFLIVAVLLLCAQLFGGNMYVWECKRCSNQYWREQLEKGIQESDALIKNIQERLSPEGTPIFMYEYQAEPESQKVGRARESMRSYIDRYGEALRCDWEIGALILDLKSLKEYERKLNDVLMCWYCTRERGSNQDVDFVKKVKKQLDSIADYKKIWVASYQQAIYEQCYSNELN